MDPGRNDRTRPSVWAISILLTLLLHVAGAIGTLALRPFETGPVQPRPSEVIDVVFAPEIEDPTEEPALFTELPPNRADEPPERADFLSNVDSRAKGETAGENRRLPRLEGRSEAPHVQMDPAGGASEQARDQPDGPPRTAQEASPDQPEPSSPGGPEEAPEPTPEEARREDRALPGERPPEAISEASPARAPAEVPPRRLITEEPASVAPGPFQPDPGVQDIFQEPMHNPDGSVALPGGISLNTVAWDYAPWLQRFLRAVHERWNAPVGYSLGLIHGWTLVELQIAPSGELVDMSVLGEEGHTVLKDASLYALRAPAPYGPLPDDFPEEHLVIRIKMVYPELPPGRGSR
jgi:hypothetical protein